MRRWWRRLRRDDRGSSTVEFVFVAVLVMVPLVYLVVAVAVGQRSSLAVTQAAREAGRAWGTADSTADGAARAQVAVRLALADQGLDDGDVQVTTVAADRDCDAPAVTPQLRPGAEFAVCVARRVDLPGVPSFLQGQGIRTVGRFVVHVDDYRAPR